MFNIAVIRYYLLRPFAAQCSITLQFSISTDQLSSCPFEYAPPDRDVCSTDSVSCHVQHRYAPLPRTRQVPPSLFFFNRQQLDNSCRFFYLQVLILCHPLVQCFHCPLFSFYGSGSYRKIIHKCSAAYNIRYQKKVPHGFQILFLPPPHRILSLPDNKHKPHPRSHR